MKPQHKKILWVLMVALVAFQLGFRPIGLARARSLTELSQARYVFEQSLVGIPRKALSPEKPGGESQSSATESAPSSPSAETYTDEKMDAAGLRTEIWDLLNKADVPVRTDGVKIESENQVLVELALLKDTSPGEATRLRGSIREALSKEYSKRAGAVREVATNAKDDKQAALVVAQLGQVQLRRPVPQVKLGLDLQGGTRMVLEARPITHYAFVDQAAMEAELTKAESEPPASESAPSGAEGATPRPEAAAAAAARGEWKDTATELEAYLKTQGVYVRNVVATANGLVFDAQTDNPADVDKVQETALAFVKPKKPQVRSLKPESFFIKSDTVDRVREIIQRRVDGLGLTEPLIQIQGNRRITVEVAGTTPDDIVDVIGKPADLKLMFIDPKRFKQTEEPIPISERRTPEQKMRVVVTDVSTGERVDHKTAINDPSSQVIVRGSEMKDTTSVHPGQKGDWEVAFELKPGVDDRFRIFTAKHAPTHDPLPIVLNEEIQSAPRIMSTIGARGSITGGFTLKEANNLKTLLNAGALPVPLEVVESRRVSATLGADNVQRSLMAGMFGVIAVFIFMMSYYRLPGLVADVALVLYTGIVFAILTMFDATLTLTGIAGMILGIGMAVDANVLIFERMKEELRNKSLPMALRLGFDRAWTAIFDSNMTGLLSASVLWVMGTGAIRGFAVTLIISILSSMFTAIYVSRVLMEIVIGTRLGMLARLFLGARPESVLKEEPRRGGRPLR